MACHDHVTKCKLDIAEVHANDIQTSTDDGIPRKGSPMSMDTYTLLAEPIYPDGDLFVILLGHEESFIAGYQLSSQVCIVASTTFSRVIDSAKTTQDGHKVVKLYDSVGSEADAFRCILSVLHHTNIGVYKYLSARDLLQVAKVNYILDCDKALAPWIRLWCQTVRQEIASSSQPKTEELGMLLSSAITFKAEEELLVLKEFAARHLPVEFLEIWSRNQNLNTLYRHKSLYGLRCDVVKLYTLVADSIHSLEGILASRSQVYPTSRKLCSRCGRQHPGTAKKCHPCREIILWPEFCTKSYRVGEYLRILTVNNLWPPNILRRDDTSISQVVQRVSKMSLDIAHRCRGGTNCPLLIHINALSAQVKRVIDEFVTDVEQTDDGKVHGGGEGEGNMGDSNEEGIERNIEHVT